MKVQILKIRDADGKWVSVPAIMGSQGKPGEGAYKSAIEGGYEGTENALNKALALLPSIEIEFEEHLQRNDNPHGVSAEDVGLGHVDNTADADKPISNAVKDALSVLTSEMSVCSETMLSHKGDKNNPHGVTPDGIGAAPAYAYGTEDLTAGTSELATGKLYFVYE